MVGGGKTLRATKFLGVYTCDIALLNYFGILLPFLIDDIFDDYFLDNDGLLTHLIQNSFCLFQVFKVIGPSTESRAPNFCFPSTKCRNISFMMPIALPVRG